MGREEGVGIGMGLHVNPWLIHFNVWQKPLQYCKVISLQLIKINGKNENKLLLLSIEAFITDFCYYYYDCYYVLENLEKQFITFQT